MSEKAVKTSEQHEKAMATLTEHIAQLEQQLKEEVENNIKLEQYTRRENLRFNNIKEPEGEDRKSVITKIHSERVGRRCNTDPLPCCTSGREKSGG